VKDSTNAVPEAGKVTIGTIAESGTPGVYMATLKGQLADTYTVTPQLGGADIGTLSDTVSLTAGTIPDGVKSTFTASPANISLSSGEQSQIVLTLMDKFGNAMRGQAAKLRLLVTNSQGGTPPVAKVVLSELNETSTPGVYRATLQGTLADTYTVKPQFDNGVSFADMEGLSATVSIYADVDAAQSGFSASADLIMANDSEQSNLTLTLKDSQGNVVPGIASLLSFSVKNSQGLTPDSAGYTLSAVQELSPGIYTLSLKGTLVDTLTVTPNLNGKPIGEDATALQVAVGLRGAPLPFDSIAVSGYKFAANSGFPTTGYADAKFTLVLPNSKNAADFAWTSNQPDWISVSSDGLVTFTGAAESRTKTVTVTASSKLQDYTFTFTLGSWFIFGDDLSVSWDGAAAYCAQINAVMPAMGETTNALTGYNAKRAVGTLASEWGNLNRPGPSDQWAWVTPAYGLMSPKDGNNWSTFPDGRARGNIQALCRRTL
jgi:hypothetical protein